MVAMEVFTYGSRVDSLYLAHPIFEQLFDVTSDNQYVTLF